MIKAIGSRIMLDEYKSLYAVEFWDCIEDLFELEEVQRLNDFIQHSSTTRLQHCLNVSYYSYLLVRRLHFDYRSAARAGMLHDLFWYDWHTEKTPELHAFYHPKNALENAENVVVLNKIERDAILKHMWPCAFSFPRYKESYVIVVSDKYCATAEFFDELIDNAKHKLFAIRNICSFASQKRS